MSKKRRLQCPGEGLALLPGTEGRRSVAQRQGAWGTRCWKRRLFPSGGFYFLRETGSKVISNGCRGGGAAGSLREEKVQRRTQSAGFLCVFHWGHFAGKVQAQKVGSWSWVVLIRQLHGERKDKGRRGSIQGMANC